MFLNGLRLEVDVQVGVKSNHGFIHTGFDYHCIAVSEKEVCGNVQVKHCVENNVNTEVGVEQQVAGEAIAFIVSIIGELAHEHVQVYSYIGCEHLVQGEVTFGANVECLGRSGLVVTGGFQLKAEFGTQIYHTHFL